VPQARNRTALLSKPEIPGAELQSPQPGNGGDTWQGGDRAAALASSVRLKKSEFQHLNPFFPILKKIF